MIVVNIRKELHPNESSKGDDAVTDDFMQINRQFIKYSNSFRLLPVDDAICMIQIEIKFKCYAKK